MISHSPPPPRIATAGHPRGSLGWGIAVFYLALTVGYIFCVGAAQLLRRQLPDDALLFAYAFGAWAFPLCAGIVYAAKGKTRTALGVLLGLAMLLGVAALLIAASLGYAALTGPPTVR